MATVIRNNLTSIERTLDRELSKHPFALQMERRTGVRKTTLLFLSVCSLLLLLALKLAPLPTFHLLAYLYPALCTLGAIDSPQTSRSEDARWLAYWTLLMTWQVTEVFLGGFLHAVIPAYMLLKVAAVIYLMAPQTRGSIVIYETVVRPAYAAIREHPVMKELTKQTKPAASAVNKMASAVEKKVEKASSSVAAAAQNVKESAEVTKEDRKND